MVDETIKFGNLGEMNREPLERTGVLQNQHTDFVSKEEKRSQYEICDDKKEEKTNFASRDVTETSQNKSATDVKLRRTSGNENMVCGDENKANDDMLSDYCFVNKYDVSKKRQSEEDSLLVINTLLQEDKQNLLKTLDEQKKTSMELAGKDIENQKKKSELEATLNSLQKSFDNLREEKSKIVHQLEQQKTANGKERQRLCREMEQKTKSHDAELRKERERGTTEIEKRDKEIKKQKDEIGDRNKEIKKLKEELSNIKRVRNEVEKNKALAEEERSRLQSDSLKMSEELFQVNNERIVLQKEIREQHNCYNRLAVELKQARETYAEKINSLKAENHQLESDKEELLFRLSKLAGANLTYNNPNIADLSDNKRPTKLAEEFSELYDNEWTEAFEEINAENEEYKSTFMLELLKRANQLCEDLSNDHTKMVKKSLSTLTLLIPTKHEQERSTCRLVEEEFVKGEQSQYTPENGDEEREDGQDKLTEKVNFADMSPSEDTSCCGVEDNTSTKQSDKAADPARTKKTKLESDFEKLKTEQKKTMLEATKFFETLLSEDVKKAVTDVIITEKGINEKEHKCVIAYLAKCIDLCWSMLRHTPPVFVDFADTAFDIPFDTNKYKPYTKTGKHLAYIVWPALYLHEGGPLLSKGVAQGK